MARYPMFQPDPSPHRPLADEDSSLQMKPGDAKSCDRAELRHFSFRMASEGESWSADLALDLLLNEIVEQACLATAASGAAIALLREGEFVCRAASGNAPDLGAKVTSSSGLSGACVQSGEVQHCEDSENDPRVDPGICRQLGVRSILVMPLWKGQQMVGLFEIFSPRPHAFTVRDMETLHSLSRGVMDSVDAPAMASPAMSADEQVESGPGVDSFSEPPPPEVAPWEPDTHVELNATSLPAQAPVEDFTAPHLDQIHPGTGESSSVKPDPIYQEAVPEPAVRQLMPVSADVPRARVLDAAHAPEPRTADPGRQSSEIFSSYPAQQAKKRSFDYLAATLVVLVITLGLLLGWMLGRVGLFRTLSGDHSAAGSPPSRAATADSRQTGNVTNRDAGNTPQPGEAARAQSQPPMKPQAAAKTQQSNKIPPQESSDGLLIYQNGKLIFQQRAMGGSTSAASSHPQPDQSPSDDPPDVVIHPVPVSPQAAQAYLLKRVEPDYPEMARRQHIQGLVILEALVGKDGAIQELRAIRGNSILVTAAADAVRQWKFKPYSPKGAPVEFETSISVNFALP